MIDLFPHSPKKPVYQMLWFLLIVFVVMLFTYLIGLVLAVPVFGMSIAELQSAMSAPPSEREVSVLSYFQLISQLGIFVLPPLVFGYLLKKNIKYYFHLEKAPRQRSYLYVFLLAFTILPVINILSYWNQQMQLPEMFQHIQQWMEVREGAARELTALFLDRTSYMALAANLFLIAIIPAIGEELFFRGVLQKVFTGWFNNAHAGIFITSVLFSALHMQFFGFLPRFVLGMLFGYYFYWSRSLWLPVFAHFINNGAAVVVAFLAARGTVEMNYEEFGSYNQHSAIIVMNTLLSIFLIFFVFREEYQRRGQ